ncbi:serine/arginine repetitive matrix protein 2-like [Rhipicephalus sanguineus]|uniref:serine/arginine repetitive matrix protein 2-like n=1 Tax=Rhipicephalus sanguineus TaxID=34632 RepID=UPI001893FC7A|nr:serine/arginine repetitive matrix protein 2-like [Rhipicephalus sanguineus]
MERLSGDGEAALILDELPRPPKRKWRKRKRQQRRALWRRPYGRFRSNFVNTENIRKGVSPETSWPPGRHKRPPLVTDDPAENRDNEDPEWEPMRRLTCDEERYKAVSRVWHSRRAPDPQEDLTTFHYRRRTLGIGRSALPSSRSRRKRKASRDSQRDSDEAKRQRLDTEIFDSKIAEAKQDREREMEKARDKLNRCLREVRKERRRRERRDDSSSSSSRRSKRGRSNSSSRSRKRRSSSRRSRRRHSSSDSDSSSRRRRRSRSRSSQVERDSSTARSGRRRRPSRDTGGYSSSRRRSGRSRSSEDRRSSTLSSELSEGGYSSKSRRRGRRRRRRRSESATDSSRSYRSYRSSRSRRSRRRTPDSGDSSPRRRRRRGSSESSGGYATSRRSRSRRHSQSDYDRSPSYRSRDGSEEGSRYWKMRERKIRDDFEADRQDISSKYHAEVDKLVAVRREVSRVNDFYMGLTHTDPRMLSASNVCDYQKLDSMLREMEKTYATAAWR